jgi:hypothetical protein
MAPVSPAAPTKSMVKIGVWCVVVLFALSIATAVCLDHRNAVSEYDDFVLAAVTVESPLTDGDGRIGSFSRIPAWVSAVNSDFAGISIPTVSDRLCRGPVHTSPYSWRSTPPVLRCTTLRVCQHQRASVIQRLRNSPFPPLR